MHKMKKIRSEQLKKTSTSIWMGIISFAVITAMFATTAYAWASDSISNKGSKITAGKYAVSVMAVKDINTPFDDTNLIAKPDDPDNNGVKWVNSMEISIEEDKFDANGISQFYLSVSPFSDSTIDFKYQTQLTADPTGNFAIEKIEKRGLDGTYTENVTEIKNDNVSISSAPSDIYKITVKNNAQQPTGTGAKLKLSMQTANVGQKIVPIKDANELVDVQNTATANDLLFLTEDIGTDQSGGGVTEEIDLVIKKLGTIDLNGHTLNVKSFKVRASGLGVVTVSNGKLIIDGEQVTDNSKIVVDTESINVTVNVDSLVAPEEGVPPETTTVATTAESATQP